MSASKKTVSLFLFLGVCFSTLTLSCKQYDYTSPLPGILEFRLKTKSTIDTTQFSIPLTDPAAGTYSSMPALLRRVYAKRSDNVQLELFSDLVAIRRNPNGDTVNCLSELARDSTFVLGKAYSPPDTYSNIELRFLPFFGSFAISLTRFVGTDTTGSFVFNNIELRQPPADLYTDLVQLPYPNQPPLNFTVEEGRTTVVTITFDLDASLVRRTEWFDYRPYFYVSSVQTF